MRGLVSSIGGLVDKLSNLMPREKDPLLSCGLGPILVLKAKERVSRVKNLSDGVALFEIMIELATRAGLQPQFEGTTQDKLEEQLWRVLDSLAVRLHDEFGYKFDLNVISGDKSTTIPLPIIIDFDRLRASVKANDGAYYMRPFYAAPSHANFPGSFFDDSHAMDLIVPEGTAIRSVSLGRLVHAQLDSKEGGNDARFAGKDNRIDIRDDAGQSPIYVYRHLAYVPEASRKPEGKIILKDSAIGEVGITGWTSTAHLHFVVYKEHAVHGLVSQKLVFARS